MSMKWKPIILAALFVCAPTTQPRHAAAQAVGGTRVVENFAGGRFWDYIKCAASIAFASHTGAWAVTVLGCKGIVVHQ